MKVIGYALLVIVLFSFSISLFNFFQKKLAFEPVEPEVSLPKTVVIEQIKNAIPDGSFLRNVHQIKKDLYLVLYISEGFERNYHTFASCPGALLGESIIGRYHLGLFRNGKFIDQIKLLASPYDFKPYYRQPGSLELVYKNITSNLQKPGTYKKEDAMALQEVNLLDLKDLTGDGQPYEILFRTTAGGCGFVDGFVAGYDPETNKLAIYSDWIERFNPDVNGNFEYLFECGDHGNLERVERSYRFNSENKKYEMVSETLTPCGLE